MNIRQACIFSFEDAIKIQPKSRLEKIIDTLDLKPVLTKLNKTNEIRPKPKSYPAYAMLNALIAMRLDDMNTFTQLVERLTHDPQLRYICGFEPFGTAPSKSYFSRFYAKLAKNGCSETLFSSLVKQAEGMDLLDLTSVAIDATKVDAYEKSVPRKNIIQDGNAADWGIKCDTNGNPIKWFGYKLHIGTDVKSGIPIAIKVTPTNCSDSSVALELVAQCYSNTNSRIKYFLMDAGYDHREIYSFIRDKYHAQAIIALNKRGAKQPQAGFDWDGTPICSAGYRMVYWGSCKEVNKFRCPHVMGKCNCPFGSAWCSDSNYGMVVKTRVKDDPRLFSTPHRGTANWQKLYNMRTYSERCLAASRRTWVWKPD
ncbi:MAG: transposase [Desulfitobacteriaceae bacterium]|jgi:transposase|nr:transposase [Desulfitobacteriaceae bacterium]